MKKIIVVILIIPILFTFISCKDEEKPKVSEQHYEYGKKALEIADKFLNYEISAQKADSLIEALQTEEENLPITEFSDDTHLCNDLIECDTLLLSSDIGFFYSELLSQSDKLDYYFSKIYEKRNDIAENIGEKITEPIPFDIDKLHFIDRYLEHSFGNYCEFAEDDSYMMIDTNYYDISSYKDESAIDAIKTINKDLGFPESTYQKMLQTSSLDGSRREENEKFIVSWTNHTKEGLEVMYEKKR